MENQTTSIYLSYAPEGKQSWILDIFNQLDAAANDGTLEYYHQGMFTARSYATESKDAIQNADLVVLFMTGAFHENPSISDIELPALQERASEGKRIISIFYEETYLPEGLEEIEEWNQSDPVAYQKDPKAALEEQIQKLIAESAKIKLAKTFSEGPDLKQSQEPFSKSEASSYQQQQVQTDFPIEELEEPIEQAQHEVGMVTTDWDTTEYDVLLIPVYQGQIPHFLNEFLHENELFLGPNLMDAEVGTLDFLEYNYQAPADKSKGTTTKTLAVIFIVVGESTSQIDNNTFEKLGRTLTTIPELLQSGASNFDTSEQLTILSYLHKEIPPYLNISEVIPATEKGLLETWNVPKAITLWHQINPIEESLLNGETPSPRVMYQFYRDTLKLNPFKNNLEANVWVDEYLINDLMQWDNFSEEIMQDYPWELTLKALQEAKSQKISFFEFIRDFKEDLPNDYFHFLKDFMERMGYNEELAKNEVLFGFFGSFRPIEIAINFTQAKISGKSLEGLDPFFRNLFRYFYDPENVIPIFHQGERETISRKLIQQPYNESVFDRQLSSFMPKMEVSDPRVKPSLIASLIQHPLSRRALFQDAVNLTSGKNRRPTSFSGATAQEIIDDRTISTYNSDTAHDQSDQLNITPDVNAFAYLISSKKLQPPLSIGLFGDWGSGKSFFMNKLEEKINNITSQELQAQDADQTGEAGDPASAPPIGFCKNIVQITFNAWYYIDANLWASLVTTIFEKLSSYVGNKTEDEQEELELLKRLESSKKEFEAAEAQLKKAQESTKEKEEALKQAKKDPEVKQAQLEEALRLAEAQELQATAKQKRAEIQKTALENQIKRLLSSRTNKLQKQISDTKDQLAKTSKPGDKQILQTRLQKLNTKLEEYLKLKELKDPKAIQAKLIQLDSLSDQQNQLFQDLSTTREQLQEAWADREHAVEQEKKIQLELNRLSEKRQERQKALNQLLVKDIYKTIKQDPKLQEFIAKGKKELEIPDTISGESVEEIQKAIDYSLSVRHRFHEMMDFFRKDLNKPRSLFVYGIFLFLGIFLVFGLPILLQKAELFLSQVQELIIGLSTLIAGGITLVNKFFKAVKPQMNRISKGISFLEAAKDRFKNQEKYEKELLDKQIKIFQDEYHRAVEAETEARTRLREARQKVEAIEQEMEAIRKGKRLASFIEKRLSSNDYQQYLGLISLIRNDFDKLSNYLQDLALQADDDKKVERIILYIDDLDRCPPDKVVDVLQAIHLILAFPLFVVVVGVDVRWISKSLIRRYGFMISPYDNDGRKTELPAYYRDGATPYAYLEKIFQIPFRLKPLNDYGKSKMIQYLLSKDIEEMDAEEVIKPQPVILPEKPVIVPKDSEPTEEPTEKPEDKPVPITDKPVEVEEVKENIGEVKESLTPIETVKTTEPDRSSTEGEAGTPDPTETIYTLPDAKSLKVSRAEMDFIEVLLPILGDSPRAVKRFVNVFRLVKSNTKLNEVNLPEVKIYEGVLTLLAIIIGAPACAKLFFRTLQRTNNKTLADVIQNMKVNEEVEEPERAQQELQVLQDFFNNSAGDSIERIRNFDPDDLMQMAPLIVRFSFRVS